MKIPRWNRSFIAPCVFTPFTGNVLPPSIHKRKEHIFRTLKIRKNSENFPSTSFGDIGSVLNERKRKIKEKAQKIIGMRQKCHHTLDFLGFYLFFVCRPPGPNFAEIHARGRRGRLEYVHRDLIPPLGAWTSSRRSRKAHHDSLP